MKLTRDGGKARSPVLKHDLGLIDLSPSAGTIAGDGAMLPVTWLDETMMKKLMDLVMHAYMNQSGVIKSPKESQLFKAFPPRKELSVDAKRALLTKHGIFRSKEDMLSEDVEEAWLKLWEKKDIEMDNPGRSKQMQPLLDLIHTKKSNGNLLKWTIMDCLPGTKFQLHAHPNIELVYCLQGELHEIRMSGTPLTTTFESKTKEDEDGKEVQISLSLQDCKRSWYFDTLKEGHWLVNEVGSIHQSFTSSNEGCILVALWSDHANIQNSMQPKGFNVADVIDEVDKRLCCSNDDSVSLIGETFLPPSEKS